MGYKTIGKIAGLRGRRGYGCRLRLRVQENRASYSIDKKLTASDQINGHDTKWDCKPSASGPVR